MELVKDYIIRQVAANKLSQDEAKAMLKELKSKQTKDIGGIGEIAIIGMACRFPGAKNTQEYWNNLLNGVSCIGDLSEQRKRDNYTILSNPLFRHTIANTDLSEEDIKDGKAEFVKAGYLDEIDKFDAAFFRIPPREAKFIDPMQRIFMEVAWESIEDAGYGGKKIYGTKTGVFVGRDNTNGSIYKLVTEQDQMHLTGSWTGILASRISYIFNLRGPGLVIDTACSSGATAIHEACQALRNKECDYAIAGGIHIDIQHNIRGQKTNMEMVESGDSKVRTFDKNANGTVWGEGVGVLFLKPLSKAIADGDSIYAVIKGSAVNNDGASNGITAPNAEAQEEVIIGAWKDAKVNPESISYIEAHGTGTVLGDPIEIKGIVNAFGRYTDKKQFCGIGSVKTNIGHLVGASGVASIIKVVLSIKHGMLPATINFEEPNPYINFNETPIYVNDRLKVWESDSPKRAGVSSFGFSGTNCHIVVEEAPNPEDVKVEHIQQPQILTISARNENVLMDFVNKYADYLNRTVKDDIRDICSTANTGRGHFDFRLAFVVKSLEELKSKISIIKENGLKDLNTLGVFYGNHKIAPGAKKVLEDREITEEQKGRMSLEAINLLNNVSADENTINELCRLYVGGADFEWDTLYTGQVLKRVHLPVYPFERIRLWAEPREFDIKWLEKSKSTHPLFDDEGIALVDCHAYITRFNIQKHWVLSEHKVMGNHIIPGTTYLEMARQACKVYYKDKKVEMKDILFINPLVVGEEGKDVQTIIKKENNHLEFVVASRATPEDDNWDIHAEGKIYQADVKAPNVYNINELRVKCNTSEISTGSEEQGSVFELGPRWKNADRVNIGVDEALISIYLPEQFYSDLGQYSLHPALLDNAVNALIQNIGEGVYLPFSYKKLVVFDKMPERFLSYVRKKTNTLQNLETITFDISLMDSNGLVFAEIEDYSIKKVHKTSLTGNANPYYEIGWIPIELETQDQKPTGGSILIFKDDKGIAEKVIQKIEGRVIEVERGSEYKRISTDKYQISGTHDDYARLINEIGIDHLKQIIHLMTLSDVNIETPEDLEDSQQRGIYSLFNLTRVLVEAKCRQILDIILVSEYVKEVTGSEETLKPHNATLFGLGITVGQEYENLKCRCIDIDTATPIDNILPELQTLSKAQKVAYRNGKRYIQELKKLKITRKDDTIEYKNSGVYVITGGLGGIGLSMAKHLASKANVNIALIGRTVIPPKEEWDYILENSTDSKLCKKINAIRHIEALGSKIILIKADVAIQEQMKIVFDNLKRDYKAINGIIHLAGVAGDGFIINRSREKFSSCLTPKVAGTWLLDSLTAQENLDFFVMFSSVNCLTSYPGQGDYAAANSYLDSFVAYRRKNGRKALTINWPLWKEIGMGVDYGLSEEDTIFKPISVGKGMEIFEELINCDVANNVYPVELNHKLLSVQATSETSEFPILLCDSIKADIERQMRKFKGDTTAKRGVHKEDIIIKGANMAQLGETEKTLAYIWAGVLGLTEIDIYKDLHEMGGDSIIASRLIKEISKEFPEVVDISDLYSYSSVAELATHIDSKGKSKDHARIKEAEVNDNSTQEEEGVLELIPVQRCFFARNFTNMHHWNTSMIIEWRDFNEQVLRIVLQKFVEYHEGLRSVFKVQGDEIIQYIRRKDEECFEFKVFTVNENIEETVKQEMFKLQGSINLEKGPLVKVGLFKTPEKDYLIVIIHHLITDGTSIRIMMADLINGYVQVATGQEIILTEKTDSLKKWSRYINTYAVGDEIMKEFDYWKGIENKDIFPLPKDHAIEVGRLKDSAIISVDMLSEENTKKLMTEACKKYRVNVEHLLLTALGVAGKQWTGYNNTLVRLCGNGRDLPFEGLDITRTVGWLSISYPVVIQVDDDYASSINSVKTMLFNIPNKGIGYDILRFITLPKKMKDISFKLEPEIFFNYLGVEQSDSRAENNQIKFSKVPEPIQKNPESQREYVFVIEFIVIEGKLRIQFTYNKYEYEESTILGVIEMYKKALMDIIE